MSFGVNGFHIVAEVPDRIHCGALQGILMDGNPSMIYGGLRVVAKSLSPSELQAIYYKERQTYTADLEGPTPPPISSCKSLATVPACASSGGIEFWHSRVARDSESRHRFSVIVEAARNSRNRDLGSSEFVSRSGPTSVRAH